MLRFRLLVQRRDGIGHEIDLHDVDLVVGPEGQRRQSRKKTNARTISNCVVSARRLSPSTMLGRKMVIGTSGSNCRIMCSQNFFVRA